MKTTIDDRKVIEVLPAGTISGTKNELPWRKKQPEDLTEFLNPKNFVGIQIVNGPKCKVKKCMKGRKKTSDYIDYDIALDKGRELLWNDKYMTIGFYIIFSINTGLRVSDVMSIKHSDMVNLKPGDYLTIQEQKTKKVRKIQINDKIIESYKYLSGKLQDRGDYKPDDYVFKSQKNMVFATVSINRILKTVFAGKAHNISSHSLRKSFGRRVYEANKRSEHALILLSDIFQHSNTAITRRYLGLRQEEIDNVYLNL